MFKSFKYTYFAKKYFNFIIVIKLKSPQPGFEPGTFSLNRLHNSSKQRKALTN